MGLSEMWSAGRFLPVVAIAVATVCAVAILGTAGSSLGYDYAAYVQAGQRILDGRPLYDPAVDVAGGFAIYLYPPPFALALVPFALLPAAVGPWPWIALLIVAFLAGVALLPVPAAVRWLVLLLGGMDWPVLFALKLGQVGPLLFLAFALAWRWLDRPVPFGAAAAAGTIVKLQPALLLGWAALTGRRRAFLVGLGVVVAAALVATVVLGPGVWADYVALLRRVSAPVATPHNFTPGAIAYQLGAGEAAATAIQMTAAVATIVVILAAIRFASAEASLLATIVGSQLLSPLLWDHYAIVLLLPTAYLLARGHFWAAAIPLLTSLPLIGLTPSAVYPLAFGLCLVALVVVGWRRAGGTNGLATAFQWLR
ncbi:MAG: DUF2029 domain-containing protein [Chloroflexota bacterium]|nr:DUF2029 domain-containing protein [Chloroflexota bacterium]